jgi:hypothetical protein
LLITFSNWIAGRILSASADTTIKPQDDNLPPWLSIIIAIIGSAVISSVVTTFVAPWMKERYKIREDYIVPYRKWCGDMSGEILEYKFILEELKKERDGEKKDIKQFLSDNYIILHFWEIHDTVRAGHKWIGKVKKIPPWWDLRQCLHRHRPLSVFSLYLHRSRKQIKRSTRKLLNENKTESDTDKDKPEFILFRKFLDFFDTKWHDLENNNPILVKPNLTEEAFRQTLFYLAKWDPATISSMVKAIKEYFLGEDAIGEDDCERMLQFLEQQIP